jgi:MoaA/NifB/PqqE/SkfB family radical SAM enzyme
MSFDVTAACNLSCIHCYNDSGKKYEDELTDEEAMSVARQIAEFSPVTVCICGGEPLVRKNLMQIIECVSSAAGSVNMVTNGLLINEHKVHELAESGLTAMQVSLDGVNAFQHDILRNYQGSFDKAINAIKLGKQAGLEIHVAMTPSKLNYRTIEQYVKMCRELGITLARIMPLIPMGRGKNIEHILLSSEEYLEVQLAVLNANKKYRTDSFYVEWGDPLEHYIRMPLNAQADLNTFQYEIKANGNITVSTYIPVVVGNIRKHSLKEYWDAGYKNIWKNQELLEYISSIQTIYDVDKLKPTPYSGKYHYIELID